MRLIIVRHGETFANEKRISCGWHNSGLNEKGKLQAKKLALRLLKEKIDVIFCSDLKRCKQTIEPYLKKRKKPIHYTKLLREQNYGVLDGKPMDIFIKWFKDNSGKDPKGWESKEKLKEKLEMFVIQKLLKYKGKNILIVTHGRTKKMLLNILLKNSNIPSDKINEPVLNTAISIINITDSKNPIAELLNCSKHLS